VSDYIERRRQQWYAVLDVPEKLWPVIGKKRLVQSLKTTSRSTAVDRARLLVSAWKRKFKTSTEGASSVVAKEASEWRQWLEETAKGDDEMQAEVASMLMTSRAEEIERTLGLSSAQLFANMAQGKVLLISEMGEKWLEEAKYREKSDHEHRYALKLLVQRHSTVEGVTRKVAGEFVRDVLSKDRKSATVNKLIGTYLQLWKFMLNRGLVETNPWTAQGISRRRASDEQARRPFTEEEGAEFLHRLDKGVDQDVVMLLAVTGMRLEEACQLKPGDVALPTKKGAPLWLTIREGKTKAAQRRVPVVVPEVVSMLRARATAKHAYIFHELEDVRWGDRSVELSKRLGRRLRSFGFTDKGLVAGHSWRHRGATLIEQAGVARDTQDAVLGHQRAGMGRGRYSRGPSDEQLVEAVKALRLPVGKLRRTSRAA
jgi:integrase